MNGDEGCFHGGKRARSLIYWLNENKSATRGRRLSSVEKENWREIDCLEDWSDDVLIHVDMK